MGHLLFKYGGCIAQEVITAGISQTSVHTLNAQGTGTHADRHEMKHTHA